MFIHIVLIMYVHAGSSIIITNTLSWNHSGKCVLNVKSAPVKISSYTALYKIKSNNVF